MKPFHVLPKAIVKSKLWIKQEINWSNYRKLSIIFSGGKKPFPMRRFSSKILLFFFFLYSKTPTTPCEIRYSMCSILSRGWTTVVLISWERGRIRKKLPSDHLGNYDLCHLQFAFCVTLTMCHECPQTPIPLFLNSSPHLCLLFKFSAQDIWGGSVS